MKSLVLKDLYNIKHNSKSMLIMLLFFTILMVAQNTLDGLSVMTCILCTIMVITTFSFDEYSKWVKYAMILPISKKDYVLSKFVVLIIFSLIGAGAGIVLEIADGLVFHKFPAFGIATIIDLLSTTLIGLAIAVFLGSLTIPLLFKYGAEKARIMTIVCFAVPVAVFVGILKLLNYMGIQITEHTLTVILYFSPAAALIVVFLMFRISFHIFSKKELIV